jgi:hypothetical protein
LTAIGPTGCVATDVTCLCANSSFISSIAACTKTSCSAEDQAKTAGATAQICPNVVGAAAGSAAPSSAAVVSSAVSSSVAAIVSSAAAAPVTSSVKVTPVAPIATGTGSVIAPAPKMNGTATAAGNGTAAATSAKGSAAATTSKPASYTGAASSVSVGLGLLALMGFAAL